MNFHFQLMLKYGQEKSDRKLLQALTEHRHSFFPHFQNSPLNSQSVFDIQQAFSIYSHSSFGDL